MNQSIQNKSIITAACLCAALTAHATEGGLSVDSNGAENFMAGALPPPGIYALEIGNHYKTTRVNDASGNDLKLPGFKVEVNAVASGFLWMTGTKVFGGDLGAIVVIPLIDLSVDMANTHQSKSGIGDIKVGLGVGYHHSPNLHSVAGFDVFLPTGAYNKADLANIGKNHSAFQPVYIVTYIDPTGFNGDLKMGYAINGKNHATGFTSGNEFHADYAAGWGLGNGWTIGVGGYVYRQITDDFGPGADSNRGSAMAIGPSIKYDGGKGWFATLKFENEFNVKNRTQGNSLWLKVALPL